MTTKKLLTTIAILAVVFTSGCKEDDFGEIVGVCPVVESTSPVDDVTTVLIDKVVTATFNENMNPSTITSSSFTLHQGTTPVLGTVSYTGTTASFTPTLLLKHNTTYTGTITQMVKDLMGNPIQTDYVWSFTTVPAIPPANAVFSTADSFGIMAGVGISNAAGPSVINNMDVGIYPGFRSSITGFFDVDGGPGLINNGAFYAANDAAPTPAMLLQAKNDLVAAYLFAEAATSPAPARVAGDLGGITLATGIYKSTSTLLIQSGNLTLDAMGNADAVWIFQIASDLTTVGQGPFPSAAGGNVILAGGAQAKNVYWQVGNSAVIGDYTSFKGNILALTSITMNSFSQIEGRLLCQNGAVTLTSTNTINKP